MKNNKKYYYNIIYIIIYVIILFNNNNNIVVEASTSIIDKYNATLKYLNATHGQTCAWFYYPYTTTIITNNNNSNISMVVLCNATIKTNCTNSSIINNTTTTISSNITNNTNNNTNNNSNVNSTNTSNTNSTTNNNATNTTKKLGEYIRTCYICPLQTFVNQTNGGCSMKSCNASFDYDDGYCINNISSKSNNIVVDITRVVYTNESLALINILSTFILQNDTYVIWNIIFAVTVLTYVLYIPWLLSLSIAFLIKFFYLGKDKDLKIGNIRFAFLGGKLALHDVQYASKNVYVRVQRLVLTLRWWAPLYRKEESWVADREDGTMHDKKNTRNSKQFKTSNTINVNSENSNSTDDLSKKNIFKQQKDSSRNAKKNENEENAENRFELPYRITLDLLGLEMMAFNNSAVYDELEKLQRKVKKENKKDKRKSFEEVNGDSKKKRKSKTKRKNGYDENDTDDDEEAYDDFNASDDYRSNSMDNLDGLEGGDIVGDDDEDNLTVNPDTFVKALDLPWFYKASPTMKIRIKCGNFYAGNQRTPTILIGVVQSSVVRHTAKLLSNVRSAKNKHLDKYRVYTRADMHNVSIIAIGNADYISAKIKEKERKPDISLDKIYGGLRRFWNDTRDNVREAADIVNENYFDTGRGGRARFDSTYEVQDEEEFERNMMMSGGHDGTNNNNPHYPFMDRNNDIFANDRNNDKNDDGNNNNNMPFGKDQQDNNNDFNNNNTSAFRNLPNIANPLYNLVRGGLNKLDTVKEHDENDGEDDVDGDIEMSTISGQFERNTDDFPQRHGRSDTLDELPDLSRMRSKINTSGKQEQQQQQQQQQQQSQQNKQQHNRNRSRQKRRERW